MQHLSHAEPECQLNIYALSDKSSSSSWLYFEFSCIYFIVLLVGTLMVENREYRIEKPVFWANAANLCMEHSFRFIQIINL